mmetsp:Transcript_13307/g.24665  ORF Transcript_13307/g.24665 Transcript_13307/m.24665 type:complete len:944 (-) Transcript_13307:42-2873(-)
MNPPWGAYEDHNGLVQVERLESSIEQCTSEELLSGYEEDEVKRGDASPASALKILKSRRGTAGWRSGEPMLESTSPNRTKERRKPCKLEFQRVVVAARVRPLLGKEEDRHINDRQAITANVEDNSVTVWLPPSSRFSRTPDKAKRKRFQFDHVFHGESSQVDVYKTLAEPLIDSVLQGVNACLIAYGQTGAGKTYTTFGPNQGSEVASPAIAAQVRATARLGLIPRAVHTLFERLDAKVEASRNERVRRRQLIRLGAPSDVTTAPTARYSYAMYVSYYQIYLDSHIQDLLEPKRGQLHIRIAERHKTNKPHQIEGLSRHRVTSVAQVLELLDLGDRNKVMAHTSMNASSSRSHSIFSVELVQRTNMIHPEQPSPVDSSLEAAGPNSTTLLSKLTCVDLAGSERASRTHPQGLQLEETKSINRSLAALGNVIAAISSSDTNGSSTPDPKNRGLPQRAIDDETFVPWRDSKLTRALQECLDGKARVSLVINVAPTALDANETVNSLLFGRRSMRVSVEPQINQVVTRENEEIKQSRPTSRGERGSAKEPEYGVRTTLDPRKRNNSEEWENVGRVNIENKCATPSSAQGESNTISKLLACNQQAQSTLEAQTQKMAKMQETIDLLEEALVDQLQVGEVLNEQIKVKTSEAECDREALEELVASQDSIYEMQSKLNSALQRQDEADATVQLLTEELSQTKRIASSSKELEAESQLRMLSRCLVFETALAACQNKCRALEERNHNLLGDAELKEATEQARTHAAYLEAKLEECQEHSKRHIASLNKEKTLLEDSLQEMQRRVESAESRLESMMKLQVEERALFNELLNDRGIQSRNKPTCPVVGGPSPKDTARSTQPSPPKAPLEFRFQSQEFSGPSKKSSTAARCNIDLRIDSKHEADELSDDHLRSTNSHLLSTLEQDVELLSSPRLKRALRRSKEALSRAMEAIK